MKLIILGAGTFAVEVLEMAETGPGSSRPGFSTAWLARSPARR